MVRIGGRSQSDLLKKHNLTELLENRKQNRPAIERSARRNVGDEAKRARDKLTAALMQLQQAWADAPLTAQLLRNAPELRGPLAQEIRRLAPGDLFQWLQVEGASLLHGEFTMGGGGGMHDPFGGQFQHDHGGQNSQQNDLMTVLGAQPLTAQQVAQHCNAAETHHHRGGEDDYTASMPALERWKLHNAIKESCKQSTVRELEVAIAHYRRLASAISEFDEAESLEILSNAAVVGLTTTGAAKHQALVRRLGCRVLVMEEAAEVLEAHVLAALTGSTQQLLLIGDHQQLRPSAACHELTLRYGFNVSLFERALNNDVPFVRLRTQRRMRPAISRLIAPIYSDLLNHSTVCIVATRHHVASEPSTMRAWCTYAHVCSLHTLRIRFALYMLPALLCCTRRRLHALTCRPLLEPSLPQTHGRPRIAGLASCVHFITHDAPERQRDDLMSPENPHEVMIITLLAALLHGLGYATSRITVLSAYVGQLLLIRAAFAACGLEKILVSTVDAYQVNPNP